MLSMIYLLCAPLLFSSVVMPLYSNKEMEGYPTGYLSDCPGSTKPAIITKKSLKYLTITVSGAKAGVKTKRTKYSYFQMKELAKDPSMDFNKKTIMYVGGFLDSPNFPFATTIETYYRKMDYNVWLLDINRFTTMEYPAAARFMRTVAKHTGEMLANLTEQNIGFDPKKFEIIGLSLGAQTMGLIAKSYTQLTGLKISRLVGMDPSGVCFRHLGPKDRLDPSDADLVISISTNIDGHGIAAPLGHVTFYVNGGEHQPGDILWMPCDEICSHFRSFFLWLAALEHPNSFIAVKCKSVQQARENGCYKNKPMVTNVVGLNTDRNKPGIFYLATSNRFPYFLGEKGLFKGNDFFSLLVKNVNAPDVMVT